MSDGVIAALIGAAGTLIAAWIATRGRHPPNVPSAQPTAENRRGSAEGPHPIVRREPRQLENDSDGEKRAKPIGPRACARFDAVIRTQGNYADGQDNLFIAIRKADAVGFPFKDGERVEVDLEVNGRVYAGGVRTTSSLDIVYIASDLRTLQGKEVRLAAVLATIQLYRNDRVTIEVDEKGLRLIVPALEKKRSTSEIPAEAKERVRSDSPPEPGAHAGELDKEGVTKLLRKILLTPEHPVQSRFRFNSHEVELTYAPNLRETYPLQFRAVGYQTVSSAIGTRELNHKLSVFFGRLVRDEGDIPIMPQ